MVSKVTRCFLFIYCLGNCIAYTLITLEQGASFLHPYPHLAPILTLVLIPFLAAKNVAMLKVCLIWTIKVVFYDKIKNPIISSSASKFWQVLTSCVIQYSGYVSIGAMVVLAITVALDFFLLTEDHQQSNANFHASADQVGFIQLFGTFPMWCFAYQAHFSSVKIYRRIERPKTFPYISAGALMVCFVIYNLVGCFCLATKGKDVDPQMLNSYSEVIFSYLKQHKNY